jgi:predicted RNase H-like HicB family nuclease
MKKYLVVVEKAEGNYGAYLPDVDGCVATGRTVKETVALLSSALEAHFELMAEEGYPIPEPTAVADYVEVNLPEPAARKSA